MKPGLLVTPAARPIPHWLLVISLLFGPAMPVPANINVTDDGGRVLTLAQPATRIVSLAPHVTELLFAAGAGDRVVAAVTYSDYPSAARELPRVGDAHNLDIERILSLRPDLIVAWGSGNNRAQVDQLKRLGMPVYTSEPGALESIADTLVDLGRLAGTTQVATAAAEKFRQQLGQLRDRYSGESPIRVFYQIWPQPLITVGGRHVINEVIEMCGGRNIFAELDELAPRVSREAVLNADPEVIITGTDKYDRSDIWTGWQQMHAVRHGHIHAFPTELLHRQGPRIIDGAELMCDYLEQTRHSETSRD